MVDVILSKKNESQLNIDCEMAILYELAPHFEFYTEGYKYAPKYKAGLWDGKIRLLDLRFGTLPLGLVSDLITIIGKLGYTYDIQESEQYGSPNDKDSATYEEVKTFIKSLKISRKNKDLQIEELEIRDYQISSVFNCIKNQRQISLNSTGSGKSVILFCLYRWYLSKGCRHFMLVVPNLGLIRQMYSDFKEYSLLSGFDVDASTQIIADGASKEIKKSLLVCTWQSIFKMPSKWYAPVDVIAQDECHLVKADCLRGIFEKATNVKYKFGVTGSLDKSATNKMVLRGVIGDISKEKSTRDLIEEGHLSDLKIKCIMLKYNKETKKAAKTFDYQNEIDFLFNHKMRNNFILNLALSLPGNTLLLFSRIEHGELLYELIKERVEPHQVHFISGKVEADDRERIRKLVQASDEKNIVLGSVGTTSTGWNLPRLHNIIFAAPTKSIIRVMQSIGRGLRKADDKDMLRLYDIVDVLNPSKSSPNFTLDHFTERLKIYLEESHPYTITEFQLEK